MYAVPFGADKVLEIDATTNPSTVRLLPLAGVLGAEKWQGCGVLNGKVYAPPKKVENGFGVLEVDATSVPATVSYISVPPCAECRCWELAAAPNGKLYAGPGSGKKVMEVDVVLRSARWIDVPGNGGGQLGITLADNGLLYTAPKLGGEVLEVDPATATLRSLPLPAGVTEAGWLGLVRAPDGNLYGAPISGSHVLKISFGGAQCGAVSDAHMDAARSTCDDAAVPTGGTCTVVCSSGVVASTGTAMCVGKDTWDTAPKCEADVTVEAGGAVAAGIMKWAFFTVAPNGKLYAAPRNEDSVLEYDPLTDTAKELLLPAGVSGDIKFLGTAAAPNGKVFGVPQHKRAGKVLELDTSPGAKLRIRYLKIAAAATAQAGYFGACTADNGRVYGIPQTSTRALEIDPTTSPSTVRTLALPRFGTSTANKWSSCAVLNGKVYAAPYENMKFGVLEIDATTTPATVSYISVPPCAGCGFVQLAAAPNGKLYAALSVPWARSPTSPSGSTERLLEVDVVQRKGRWTDVPGSGTHSGMAVADNGLLYTTPGSRANGSMEFDSLREVFRLLPLPAGVRTKGWLGLVRAPNGNLYGTPGDASVVLKISFGAAQCSAFLTPHMDRSLSTCDDASVSVLGTCTVVCSPGFVASIGKAMCVGRDTWDMTPACEDVHRTPTPTETAPHFAATRRMCCDSRVQVRGRDGGRPAPGGGFGRIPGVC